MIGMKDQYFGVEVEMTGITREQAATALAAYFATDARYVGGAYDKWCVTDRDCKEWTVMSDSSIHGEQKIGSGYRATGDYRYRVEMVTPKLTYAELPKLQQWNGQQRDVADGRRFSAVFQLDPSLPYPPVTEIVLYQVFTTQSGDIGERQTSEATKCQVIPFRKNTASKT